MALETAGGRELWRRDTGGPATSVAVFDETLLVDQRDSSVFHVLDRDTGELRRSRRYMGPPVADDGRHVCYGEASASNHGYGWAVMALDTTSGDDSVLFQGESENPPSVEYALSDGVGLCLEQRLSAVCVDDGRTLWEFGGEYGHLDYVLTSDSLVYAGVGDHTLYALQAASGSVLWRACVAIDAAPLSSGHLLMLLDRHGELLIVERPSGEVLAPFATDPRIAPIVRGGNVYAVDDQGRVIAVDPTGARVVWRSAAAAAIRLLTGDSWVVFADAHGSLHRLKSDDGSVERVVAADVAGPLRLAGDALCFLTATGDLAARSLTTGRELWRFRPAETVTDLVSTPGLLICATGSAVYALSP